MENKKEAKKTSPLSYIIAILIIAAIAYVYFCTDIIRTRPVSQEGSAFVGTYIEDTVVNYNGYEYSVSDTSVKLVLNSDGTGDYYIGYTEEDPGLRYSILWTEDSNTANITIQDNPSGKDNDMILWINESGEYKIDNMETHLNKVS